MACGAEDTEAWATQADAQGCTACGAAQPAGKSSCRQCGAGPDQVEVLRYAGCKVCTGTGVRRARQGAVAASMRPAPCAAPGEVSRSLWKLVGTLGVLCGSMQVVNTMTSPVYHIVEEPGAIERMTEVEVPTEYYYDRLREDMKKRHPNASWHVLDHAVSLEAFLDVSILSGFSFGIDKAKVLVASGSLLGRIVGRDGVTGDEERAQAVRDFAPLKSKQHVQQFAGCTNWLRPHMREEYAQALKVLGEYMKPGAEFPPEGLGPGTSPGDKAVRAIKIMAAQMIKLAVLDEAAAIDGTRPFEQIADSSGIAWGGTSLQMSRDLSGFNVLMTAGKGLTPAQQSWPPLTLEGYAQLETKRAQKKSLGAMKSLCWTDHANWTRQLVLEDIDVKHLRWVSWIVADGSQIRSLSGRSAKLGDGFSRNPSDRDALIEQRTRTSRAGRVSFEASAWTSFWEIMKKEKRCSHGRCQGTLYRIRQETERTPTAAWRP